MNRRSIRWLLASSVAALLISCGGLAMLRSSAVAQSGVEDARGLWATRNFDAYTLVVSQKTRAGTCEQQIAIADEQAQQAISNTCGQPPTMTVTRLLNWIVELERTPSRCYPGPSACACQATATTMVTYDSELGYPRTIVYEWRSRPNLVNPVYWRMLTDKSFPGCSNIQGSGTGGTLVVNVNLVPEP